MLRLAYKEVTGNEIEPSDHQGGNSALNVCKKLGFKTLHLEKGRNLKTMQKLNQRSNQNRKEVTKRNRMQIPTRGITEQKNALQLILNKIFDGDIVSEKTFDWMKTPKETPEELSGVYRKLFNMLQSYRGHKFSYQTNSKLRCDFFCESRKLIIEY